MKVYFSIILFVILCHFLVHSECSFPNFYREIKSEEVRGDPGKPLYLTPLIEKKLIKEAQQAALVNFTEFQNVKSYSGYLTVDKRYDSNLFFWFFPSAVNYLDVPVLLWLQGGPGSSSMYGLFRENGPLKLENDTVKLRKESWSSNHSVLYIDNPVGTGFSFTNGGYAKNETKVGEDLYQALKQFFLLFPELQKNDFFVTGESYAGKYVPAVAHTIHKHNQKSQFKINLSGLAIGNGLCDPEHQLEYGKYLYQIGLVDSQQEAEMTKVETQVIKYIRAKEYGKAFEEFDELLNGDLITHPTMFKNFTGFDNYFDYLISGAADLDGSLGKLFSRAEVRAAIHVGNTPFGDKNVEEYLKNDVMQSVAPWIKNLLNSYRILFYNGQLDIIVAYPLTVNFLKHLNFNGADQYKTAPRRIWSVGSDVAGYIKQAGNLIEVLVRNAGHLVPSEKPIWALELITKFTRNQL